MSQHAIVSIVKNGEPPDKDRILAMVREAIDIRSAQILPHRWR